MKGLIEKLTEAAAGGGGGLGGSAEGANKGSRGAGLMDPAIASSVESMRKAKEVERLKLMQVRLDRAIGTLFPQLM